LPYSSGGSDTPHQLVSEILHQRESIRYLLSLENAYNLAEIFDEDTSDYENEINFFMSATDYSTNFINEITSIFSNYNVSTIAPADQWKKLLPL
jgi:hypothetical protein